MIEKLFTSKNRIKILELLLFSNKAFNMREIERKLNIPISAVKREIDNLEELSIIKKSNNKYESNEGCNFIGSLSDILLKTDSFKFEIEKELKGKKIYFAFVFGSFANSNYNDESDIDLFIIGDIGLSEIIKLIKPIEKKLDREINPITWSLKTLKDKSKQNFIKNIAKKEILMIVGKEDELRKIIGRK
jgi:predicted nucleotidyltransferase